MYHAEDNPETARVRLRRREHAKWGEKHGHKLIFNKNDCLSCSVVTMGDLVFMAHSEVEKTVSSLVTVHFSASKQAVCSCLGDNELLTPRLGSK